MARLGGKLKKTKKRRSKKGVRYIAYKLLKYFPKRYPKFNDALPRAREIFQKIQSANLKVSVLTVFQFERVHRKDKEPIPEIPDVLSNPQDFFTLNDLPSQIEDFLPTNLMLISKISDSSLEPLQGGVNNDDRLNTDVYNDYFQGFVNFSNELAKVVQNKYPTFWRIDTPFKRDGKWFANIIPCDEDGVKTDFGYDPKKQESLPAFIPTDDYDSKKFNELRKIAKEKGVVVDKPNADKLREALRKHDKEQQAKQPKTQPKAESESKKEPSSLKELELKVKEKEETRKILEAQNKKAELELEARKMKLREQELDMEKIQYGLMTVDEFKKKWK